MLGFLLAAAGSSTLEHDPFLVKVRCSFFVISTSHIESTYFMDAMTNLLTPHPTYQALQGTRTAHREELLANGGAFF